MIYYDLEDFELLGVKTYLSDGNIPTEDSISETTVFLKEDITYLGIELKFSPSATLRRAVVSWRVYSGSGRNFSNNIQTTIKVKPGEDTIYHSWGFTEKNKWPVGKYSVSISVNYGKPITKSFNIKKSLTDEETHSTSPFLKGLLLTLLAIFCFPLFFMYLNRDSLKEWFWKTASSGSAFPEGHPSNTRYSADMSNDYSNNTQSQNYTFYDSKGNLCESGGIFYDSKGNLCEWGKPFYDGKGNYCEWGSPFYDAKGNYCDGTSPFYDWKGNLINPN